MNTPLLDGIEKEAWVGYNMGIRALVPGALGGAAGAIIDKKNRGRGFLRGALVGGTLGALTGISPGLKMRAAGRARDPEMLRMLTRRSGIDPSKLDTSTFWRTLKSTIKARARSAI